MSDVDKRNVWFSVRWDVARGLIDVYPQETSNCQISSLFEIEEALEEKWSGKQRWRIGECAVGL